MYKGERDKRGGSAVTDPDLEIRGGGRWGSGHPDPEIRGEQSTKNFFRPFGPPFGLKIRGARPPLAPPIDPPLECGREEKPDAKAVFCLFIVF